MATATKSVRLTVTCPTRTAMNGGAGPTRDFEGFWAAGRFWKSGVHEVELAPEEAEQLLGEIRRGESLLTARLENGEVVRAPTAEERMTPFEKRELEHQLAADIKRRRQAEERRATEERNLREREASMYAAVQRENEERAKQIAAREAETDRILAEEARRKGA